MRRIMMVLVVVAAWTWHGAAVMAGPVSWSYQVDVQFTAGRSALAMGESANGTAYAHFQPAGGGNWLAGTSSIRLLDYTIGGIGDSPESFTGSFNAANSAFQIGVSIRDNATGRIATSTFNGFLTGQFGYNGTSTFNNVGAMFLADGPVLFLTQDGKPLFSGASYSLDIGAIHDPASARLEFVAGDLLVPIADGDAGTVNGLFSAQDSPEPASLGLLASAILTGIVGGRRLQRQRIS